MSTVALEGFSRLMHMPHPGLQVKWCAGTFLLVPCNDLSPYDGQDPTGRISFAALQGRGSFGRVYKGRWTSSLVAIKVVDYLAHNEGADKAAAEEQRVAREALLSASLSHPNVIATYKICTVRAGDSNASSREAVEAGHRPAKPFPPPEDAECAMLPAWPVKIGFSFHCLLGVQCSVVLAWHD